MFCDTVVHLLQPGSLHQHMCYLKSHSLHSGSLLYYTFYSVWQKANAIRSANYHNVSQDGISAWPLFCSSWQPLIYLLRTFFYLSDDDMHGGLNRNGPHRLTCLKCLAHRSGAIGGMASLGVGMTLVKKMYHNGASIEVSYAQARPSVALSLLLLPMDKDAELSYLSCIMSVSTLPFPTMMIID